MTSFAVKARRMKHLRASPERPARRIESDLLRDLLGGLTE